jgi:hypothetical protein
MGVGDWVQEGAMSEGPRIPLSQAQKLADQVVNVLKPVCDRIEIAGSIRRKAAAVARRDKKR